MKKNVCSKKLKKSITTMLALLMIVTTPGVAQAATKTSSVRSTIGTYTEYVRKSDSTTELGQVTISKTRSVYKVTHDTAYKVTLGGNSVTLYVSNKSGNWTTTTRDNTRGGYTFHVDKIVTYGSISDAKSAKTYGKCSITY